MNHEIAELIAIIKASQEPVQSVLDRYMDSIEFSALKAEYVRMSATEKRFLIAKLTTERNKS